MDQPLDLADEIVTLQKKIKECKIKKFAYSNMGSFAEEVLKRLSDYDKLVNIVNEMGYCSKKIFSLKEREQFSRDLVVSKNTKVPCKHFIYGPSATSSPLSAATKLKGLLNS